MSDTAVVLDECGCCETIAPAAPAIDNPPGLSAIAYRIGTQPLFKARMKAALGTRPELLGLTARDESDPSIALVDAWATVLDVLTFYQERIATEGYLRTATETQSVYSLAAEISYLPNPGVAADVLLAFRLDTSPGSPGDVPIPVGTRVQSLPEPNAKPQTFETVEVVDARPEWNVLFPRRTVRQHLAIDETSVVLAGTSTLLRPGDALLFVGHHRRVNASSQHWDFRILESVTVDTVAGTTTVIWNRGLGKHVSIHLPPEVVQGHLIDTYVKKVHPVRAELHVYAMKTRAGIFGFNAPDWRLIPDTIRPHYTTETPVPTEWPNFTIWGPAGKVTHDAIDLDAVYAEAAQGAYAAVALQTYVELFDITQATQAARADFGLSSKVTRIKLEPTDPLHPTDHLKNPLLNFETFVRDTVVHLQGPEVMLADIKLTNPVQGRSIPLDRVVEGLNPGKQIIVTGKRARAIATQHLSFVATDGSKVTLQPGESVQMTLPYEREKSHGKITWHLRAPGGQEGKLFGFGFVFRWAPALDSDQPIAEVATIEDASELIDGTTTRLRLHDPLANCYDRASLKINANVAHATHGESKQEVLGSGDASRPFQTFTLKQAPLTYVSSAAASGAATTLEVRVDDLAWTEVPTLYGQGPHNQVYLVRIAAGGEVRVEFGDGITGARLPTGVENVRATYRVGVGRPGVVGADRIKLLMTRPQGVQSVDNPVPAGGIAADAEGLDSARQNAPQQVVTFSRVVSLTDFEDFARAFAGIAKAQADWVWDGSSRKVNVTVAGTNGAPVTKDGDTYPKLKTAITSYADPHQRFQLSSFEDLRFAIKASLFLEAGRDETVVVPAAIRAIRDAFSFERRSLGQPVFESEVIAALQATLGVMAVDLTGLHLARGSGMTPALPALRGRYDNGIQPAQLLSIGDGATDVDLKVAT